MKDIDLLTRIYLMSQVYLDFALKQVSAFDVINAICLVLIIESGNTESGRRKRQIN
jgi:hypothetical protein